MTTKYIVDNLPEQTISGSLSAITLSADTFYGDGSNLTGVSGGSFTGGTVNGETIFDGGLSATTFSATTIDLCASNGTLYTDSISGCSPINILSPTNFTQGISATTISADTIYVSGNPISKSYKVYTALLTQTGTTAPVANVLENTLGVVTFDYVLPGFYVLNATGLLTLGKTWVTLNYVNSNGQTVSYGGKNLNALSIFSRTGGTTVDNILDGTEIEIRVYN